MSFNLSVTVKDGTASVRTAGDVPNGEFVVSGHETDQIRSLGLTRRGPDGRYVQEVNGTQHKESV